MIGRKKNEKVLIVDRLRKITFQGKEVMKEIMKEIIKRNVFILNISQ